MFGSSLPARNATKEEDDSVVSPQTGEIGVVLQAEAKEVHPLTTVSIQGTRHIEPPVDGASTKSSSGRNDEPRYGIEDTSHDIATASALKASLNHELSRSHRQLRLSV